MLYLSDMEQNQNKTATTIPNYEKEAPIIDLITDIVAEIDKDNTYTWLNESGLTFFGRDAIGKQLSDFSEGEQVAPQVVSSICAGDETVCYVKSWQRRQDGERRLLAWWHRPLKDSEKNIIRVVSVARDITDEHNMEKRLNHSEKQLHSAMALARLGPWEFDVASGVFTFNDTFYALFKTTAAEVGGYTMTAEAYAKKFVHPEDAQMVGQAVGELLANKDPEYSMQLEHRIIFADGSMGHVAVRFFAEKDEFGNAIKTHGINQDITDYKMKEEKITTTKKELEEKLSELERLNKFMIDRELKMTELKDEIKTLKERLGEE